ncbi:hypothetical protein C9J12_30215 [Photobacterium frigidiphilum]|uniref:Uncharacterized protein n=1 Tax=Photobacterium frigidiphilum TaxID=264736 RepID=A0A2T3J5H8_9GAMM|nr:hypothetical protein C9J12_30215 [Photobacterium frigidiphilum]
MIELQMYLASFHKNEIRVLKTNTFKCLCFCLRFLKVETKEESGENKSSLALVKEQAEKPWLLPYETSWGCMVK